jgi:hypothetical protein
MLLRWLVSLVGGAGTGTRNVRRKRSGSRVTCDRNAPRNKNSLLRSFILALALLRQLVTTTLILRLTYLGEFLRECIA